MTYNITVVTIEKFDVEIVYDALAGCDVGITCDATHVRCGTR
jgi:hypothetical protein